MSVTSINPACNKITLHEMDAVTCVKELHSWNFAPLGTKPKIVLPLTKRNCLLLDPFLFLRTNLSPLSQPELLRIWMIELTNIRGKKYVYVFEIQFVVQ